MKSALFIMREEESDRQTKEHQSSKTVFSDTSWHSSRFLPCWEKKQKTQVNTKKKSPRRIKNWRPWGRVPNVGAGRQEAKQHLSFVSRVPNPLCLVKLIPRLRAEGRWVRNWWVGRRCCGLGRPVWRPQVALGGSMETRHSVGIQGSRWNPAKPFKVPVGVWFSSHFSFYWTNWRAGLVLLWAEHFEPFVWFWAGLGHRPCSTS